MTRRWLVRSALGMLLLYSVLGCAADTTAPLSSDAGAAGVGVKATPDTLKGTVGSLFGGNTGVVFSVSGGTAGASYFWTVEGSIPSGLAFFPPTNSTPSTTLTLFGTPSEGGLYPLTITVHTAPGHVQFGPTANFPIEIAGDSNSAPAIPPLAITWLTGVTYQQALTATGGKTPYASWFQTGLPAEITLDSTTGILSGTPSTPGTFNVTVSVLDAAGRMGIGTVSLTVRSWTLADAKGTWTGVITTDPHPLKGKRLSLLFNDQGIVQQGTMDATILATSSQSLSFLLGSGGQLSGKIPILEWHLVCDPTSSGDLACVGHVDLSGLTPRGDVTLKKINANNQDSDAPTVVNNPNPFTSSGVGGTVTVAFSELMSGTGGTSITLSGGSGTVGTPTFVGTDPTTLDARTLTIPLSQLQSSTNYTLTLNPVGQTGFRDLAGNALATKAIPFTTGVLTANQPPTATSLTLSPAVNTPTTITLTGFDPEGLPLKSARIVSPPSRGTLTPTAWTGPGPYVTAYTSANIGSDSFTFTVTDAADNVSPPATVTITTRAANTAPTATPQTVSVVHDRPLVIMLTGTDSDTGDYLRANGYAIFSNPAQGQLTGTGAAKTYMPNATYTGPDSFYFTVTDSAGEVSPPAKVTITVTNQPPTASPQSITVQKTGSSTITLVGTDPDGDTLTYTAPTAPTTTDQGGTLTGTGATRTYTPPPGFSEAGGVDTFSFTVSDGIPSDTATARVTITVSANPPPTANPQTFTFSKRITQFLYQTQYAITLTGSSSAVAFKIVRFPAHQDPAQVLSMTSGRLYQFVDPDNLLAITQRTSTTASSVDETTGPTRGTITVSPVGSPFMIIYTPNPCHVDIFAQDSFDFVAIDADRLASAPATVTMNSTDNLCSHLF